MSEKVVITLYDIKQPVIIVPAETGVIYSNQTGGCCCNHPEMEGYIIPLETKWEAQNPLNPNIFSPDWWYLKFMDDQKADEIEDMLNTPYGKIRNLKVLRDEEWEEAWVRVSFEMSVDYTEDEWTELEGILTWENSD